MHTILSSGCRGGGVYPNMHWVGEGVYPSMHWAGGASQHALGRGLCIPACTGQGVFTWGYLPKGVSVWGVCLLGVSSCWVVCPGGVCPGGVSAQGVSVHWGICPVHAGIHTPSHPPPMKRMTDRPLWKYYFAATRLRTVIIHPLKYHYALINSSMRKSCNGDFFLEFRVIFRTGCTSRCTDDTCIEVCVRETVQWISLLLMILLCHKSGSIGQHTS